MASHVCAVCNGSGTITRPGHGIVQCMNCAGTGYVSDGR